MFGERSERLPRRRSAALTVLVAALLVVTTPVPRASAITASTLPDHGNLTIQPSTVAGTYRSDRDCGSSVPLSDGRWLWVFCDTNVYDMANPANRVDDGNYKWTSAALSAAPSAASPSTPPVMRDALFPDGTHVSPWPFVPLTVNPANPNFFECPEGGWVKAVWPQAMVNLTGEVGATSSDEVLIFFQNTCWFPGGHFYLFRDVGVAVYNYQSGQALTKPLTFPASGTGLDLASNGAILNGHLFTQPPGSVYLHQFGATVSEAGGQRHLHLYRCPDAGTERACTVARLPLSATRSWAEDRANVADPAKWELLTAPDQWTADPNTAGTGMPLWDDPSDPTGEVGITRIGDLHVMSYLEAAGSTARFRVAESADGPWSPPMAAPIAGCEATVHTCRTVHVHDIPGSDQVGVTYARNVDLSTTTGDVVQLHWSTMPVAELHTLLRTLAPTGVTGSAGDRFVDVSWSAPDNGGSAAVTGYTVTASPGGGTCSWTSGPLTCRVSGLTSGVPYEFTVTAGYATGPSPVSAPSEPVTPTGPRPGVSGTATDAGTGQPAAGVTVTLMQANPAWVVADTTATDGAGSFAFPAASDGAYQLRFFDPQGRYRRIWYSTQDTYQRADVVTVVDGVSPSITQPLPAMPTGRISGRVQTASGTGIPGVLVRVYTENDGYYVGAVTGADGYYLVRGVPAGAYRVQFVDRAGPTPRQQWYRYKALGFRADTLTVGGGTAWASALMG